jgi:RNA polymerase sigma factor (sigma-70 family)
MLDIDQIENRPFGPNTQFESIDEYNKIARGLIMSCGQKCGFTYNKKLIHNDSDLVANVVHTLVLADSRFDASKGVEKKMWRYICCSNYLKRRYQQNRKHFSPNITLKDSHLDKDAYLKKQKICLNKEIEHIENDELINKYIEILSDKEQKIIRAHYGDGLTMEEIAKKNNVTKQAISLTVIAAVKKMKKVAQKDDVY